MDLSTIEALNWKNFSKNILKSDLAASLPYLNKALAHRTYLVNDTLSETDKAIFVFLHTSSEFLFLLNNNDDSVKNISRYYNNLLGIPEIKAIDLKHKQNAVIEKECKKKEEKSKSNVQFEDGGKFIGLHNAELKKIVVRFPPEASGYLHIGHAKAALINQHYKDYYQGKLIMRFDDTNPAKESLEFEQIILEDVKSLGLSFDKLTYSSDHFDTLLGYCEKLIQSGQAYADNTDPEQMKKERELCQDSKCRSQTVDQNMQFWNEMKSGKGGSYCIRIKMDMKSKNGCMRDPTIYRCKLEPHIRTGDHYRVYPTYDFACPIVDSIEGVTHTLRTSEYNDRNDQFFHILDAVGLRKPEIADYSRLSLQNTVLSKRKLTYIVSQGLVDGWDDPRMPTVRGVLRRGMTIEGLREFVLAQGFGRANVVMEWDKIWAFNKKIIDPIAPRYTGLSGSKSSLVTVRVVDQLAIEKSNVARHPKDEKIGQKSIWFTPTVFVERDDAVDFVEGTNVTFINWGNLLITKVYKHGDQITSIDAKLNLSDRDFKKTQKITWIPLGVKDDWKTYSIPMVAIFYENIITKNVLEKDDDFTKYLNTDSKREQCLIGDLELKDLKKGDIIQLQRRGFFICDEEYRDGMSTNGKEYPLVLINIPEGNKKERPTVGMKQKSQNPAKDESEKSSEVSKKLKDKKKEDPKKKSEKVKSEDNKKSVNTKEKKMESSPKTGDGEKSQSQETDEKNKMKKMTKLGLEVTKEENLASWYTQVILKSELINYYDISGCYILRPNACNIWKKIQNHIDCVIEKMGVEAAAFPMFISKSCLMKEKDHIADFSPEVAWVTMAGDKNLEEPIAIRPTSETAMYPYYAQWIQSHRDLPLKLNQWCNVVRWEFKHPIPFLRSREFLWQEGHTAYADQQSAVSEVYQILDLYASVYEDLLAIPVVKGRKTEKEKFAGADFTTTTEVYVAGSGRAIQGATSHHLGQNFSRMFDISYQSVNATKEFVYQNSWGMTTRTIGILVMVHGDNKGLVLPPNAATIQVVIVPCGVTVKTTEEMEKNLYDKCRSLEQRLSMAGCRVKADLDQQSSPGWKFNNWELKGVPIRIEVGPRDIAENKIVCCYRYNGQKETINDSCMEVFINNKLSEIQNTMYVTAKNQLDSHRIVAHTMNELCQGLDNKMLITAPFCGDKGCEDRIKTISAGQAIVEEGAPSMGAKSLCIPFDQPSNLGDRCVNSECSLKPKYFTMFGRSY